MDRKRRVLVACLTVFTLTGCSQGMSSGRMSDVISSVILVGSSAGSRGGSTSASAASARVLNTADDYLGVPYKWGGSSPQTGFDCSGYVKYVFAKQGISLPRTSREQANAGASVRRELSSLQQGDIILFAEYNEPISHVAIYAGGNRIIHSSSSGGGVRFDDLGTRRGQWYVDHMVAARRLVADGRSLVQSLEFLTRKGLPFDPPDRAPPP